MREADTSSALPQMARADAHGDAPARPKMTIATITDLAALGKLHKASRLKKKVAESNRPGSMRIRLLESEDGKPSRFRVTLITEGLGNMADGYYYPGEIFAEAAKLFEGKKIFANHPSATEEIEHPEREIQDILGHFENVQVAQDQSGRRILEADVVILPGVPFDYARSLMEHALEYSKKFPDQDFIGLSINAGGEADPMGIDEIPNVPAAAQAKILEAKEKGLTQIKYVRKITEAHSCDLVTQPGAGGRVIKFLEAKHGPKWEDCVQKVKAKNVKKSGSETDPSNPFAVCTASLGSQTEGKKMKAKSKEAKMKQEEADQKKAPPADGDGDGDDKNAKVMEEEGHHEEEEGAHHEEEEEGHKEEEEAAAGDGSGDDDGDDDDGDHADAEQDLALFKKIINQYLGKDDASEEEMEATKEAYQAATEMYPKDKKEAMRAAGHSLKMAAHKEKKIAEAKAVLAKEDAKHGYDAGKPGGKVGVAESDKKPKTDTVKLREAEGSILKLTAENARLKTELGKVKLQAYVDKKLKESKLPNVATKLFREKAGEFTSEKDFDGKLALFNEAWNEGGKPVSFSLIESERSVPASTESSGQAVSLSDCRK